MHSSPLSLAARLHQCCTYHSHHINNSWIFSRQKSIYVQKGVQSVLKNNSVIRIVSVQNLMLLSLPVNFFFLRICQNVLLATPNAFTISFDRFLFQPNNGQPNMHQHIFILHIKSSHEQLLNTDSAYGLNSRPHSPQFVIK